MSTNPPCRHNPSGVRLQKHPKVNEHPQETPTHPLIREDNDHQVAQRKEPQRPATVQTPVLSFNHTQTLPTQFDTGPSLQQSASPPPCTNSTITDMQSSLYTYNPADFTSLLTARTENLHQGVSQRGLPLGTLLESSLVFTPGATPHVHIPVYKFFGNVSVDQEHLIRGNTAMILAAVMHGGGQCFIKHSSEKAAEIKAFIQFLQFRPHLRMHPQCPPALSAMHHQKKAGPSGAEVLSEKQNSKDAVQHLPDIMIYAPEMNHVSNKNCFDQLWSCLIELRPGASQLQEYLLWQVVFTVHPTLSFSVYAILTDVQPWKITTPSGPAGAVKNTVCAKYAVLMAIKEKLWVNRGFLWFVVCQMAANWSISGSLAQLVNVATDTLDADVVMVDDPSTGRSIPAYLIKGKPVTKKRDNYC
ncbi:hypothetical protein PYCCODRAFT_1423231 [Trametes coccinea BRFM310]|uniref:Uncharacterized protein n=1 Tax=Trametes coccinea (strain BRFM310) TaxID=1353009 RepID=A0A1Y2J0K2_TRAC3|nr:hypothetical protein PYCCODRAFT_1423231 [Trametes coccinea BRFM310]